MRRRWGNIDEYIFSYIFIKMDLVQVATRRTRKVSPKSAKLLPRRKNSDLKMLSESFTTHLPHM